MQSRISISPIDPSAATEAWIGLWDGAELLVGAVDDAHAVDEEVGHVERATGGQGGGVLDQILGLGGAVEEGEG